MSHSANSGSGLMLAIAALAVFAALLGGCGTQPLHDGRIDRLPSEQVAALPANPDKARDATRLTEQADREAAQVRGRQAQLERERVLESRRQREWDLRYGHYGHPGFWSFGLGYRQGYRGPAASWRYGIGF
jgi:hypothetical protein